MNGFLKSIDIILFFKHVWPFYLYLFMAFLFMHFIVHLQPIIYIYSLCNRGNDMYPEQLVFHIQSRAFRGNF